MNFSLPGMDFKFIISDPDIANVGERGPIYLTRHCKFRRLSYSKLISPTQTPYWFFLQFHNLHRCAGKRP
jgi:hypothetical protein